MFTHLCARFARRRAARPIRNRLLLRCLEERIAPANLIVSDPGDNGGSNQLRAIWETARFNGQADTITFDPSVTTVALTSALGFYSESADLTITGNGKNITTIQSPPSSRTFDFLGFSLTSKVTITDMAFQGGRANGSNGGAIHSASTPLFLTNVKFTNNSGSSGGAVAIDGENTSLTVTGCEFSFNTAAAISANYGGGIYVYTYSRVTVTINNSTFDSNRAGTGAAFASTGSIVLQSDSCSFTNGRSTGAAGVICVNDAASITIDHAFVNQNSTAGLGGMILGGKNSNGTIKNSTISSNTASEGGAMQGGQWTLINNTFSQNTAVNSGGVASGVSLSVSNCVFSGNRAGRQGGAIDTGSESATITSSIFKHNISGTTGGAISALATTTIKSCDFDANTSSVDGGAIYANHSSVTLSDCTLHGNSSGSSGGAFYAQTDVTINQCTFNKNTAAGTAGGGAIAFNNFSKRLTINNCTIFDNTASNSSASVGGGGILRVNGPVTINSSIIAGNKLGGIGTSGRDLYNSATTTLTVAGNDNLFGTTAGMKATLSGSYFAGDNATPLDPLLTPLADNGGFSLPDGTRIKTMALAGNSLAVHKGNNSAGLTNDQRGNGFARAFANSNDIGAFEIQKLSEPFVTSVVFGDGTSQRSQVRRIVVTFSESVTFMGTVASAFTVHRSGTGGTIGDVALTASPAIGPASSVTITFSGALTESGGSLVDGFYDFIISAAQVSGSGGALDGNYDSVPGGSYAVTGSKANKFYRLFGDSNGDGAVKQADHSAFRLAMNNGPSTVFDFDDDGQVGQLDFNAFRLRFLGVP